jgi:outer membrane protein TolC
MKKVSAWRRKTVQWMLAAGVLGACPLCGEEKLVLDLQRSVALALEHNERLLLARADLDKSHQQVRQARGEGLPQLNASINYDRNWLLPTFVFAGRTVKIGTENTITGTVNLRQTLYSGGRVSASLEAARRAAAASGELERGVRQQVAAAVEAGYCDLLLARELLRVSRLALERARAHLGQVQAWRRAGRAAEFDELRAQVQVASLRADSISAENGLRLAEMAFKDAIGLDLERPVEVVGAFREEARLDLASLDGLVQVGLERRPELRERQQQLALRQRTVQVEQASNRPLLDLVASGQTQFQGNDLDVAGTEWRKSWDTGLVLQMSLFDGQRTGARVAQAQVEVKQAHYQQEQTERRIRLEIQQAWLELREAGERMEAQHEAVRQAEKGLEVAESRYAGGAGTQLQILDAQLALVQARTAFATAQRDRALSLMHLELAVGVLSEEEL